jgi:asparagine synthetase B (glutamine-hydrolysing)
MFEHWVSVPTSVGFDASSLADDTISAGPAQQPGRLALLHAMRDAGFERVFDGEGGDELFDLAWRLGDLGEQPVSLETIRVLLRPSSRRRFARDLLARGALGLVSNEWLRREHSRIAARRPWLRRSFWEGHAFGAAWEETVGFGRARHARDRLNAILEAHARSRAVQELARGTFGIAGESPLLDRDVVEFVGSLPARFAVEPGHSKALLRRVGATRLPAAVAWRPKQEPLYEWLAIRAVCDEARVDRITGAVATRASLTEIVDPLAVRAAVDAVRRAPERAAATAAALDQLFWFVEWSGAVHARYGIG